MATGSSATQHQTSWAADASPSLRRIIADDAVGQLWRREGRMAVLGSEDGALKLDWVEGVARLLADGAVLDKVEAEARAIRARGIRHLIWAGMGGSVITIRVLTELGFHGGNGDDIAIYPLDSTDPAALNDVVRRLAHGKGLVLPDTSDHAPLSPALVRELLGDVLMVGVSMGMTSEEPITHLVWFAALLAQADLSPADHLLVMTLPDSYLDRFAHEYGVPSRPLQLDGGNGTEGRMSAPTTRVFLLPAALYLTRTPGAPGQLRAVLERAWRDYGPDLAARKPAVHPFVRLAAALSDAAADGACHLLLTAPDDWRTIVQWIEQLMEESLGKGGKGVVIFGDQALSARAPCYRTEGTLTVCVSPLPAEGEGQGVRGNAFLLPQPYLTAGDPVGRLAALAASFLGWQLCMALFGYLHDITFAGQPAVENYKTRARTLREQGDPLHVALSGAVIAMEGPLTLLAPPGLAAKQSAYVTPPETAGFQPVPAGSSTPYTKLPEQSLAASSSPAALFAAALQDACGGSGRLDYLDVTMNGELPVRWVTLIDAHLHSIGNELLGVPVKMRRAPADYHSTEQSEMDGPPSLVSLRLLTRDHEPSLLGAYTDTFLRAQAVGTWQAMVEQGRPCFLLVVDGAADEAAEALHRFFDEVAAQLRRWRDTAEGNVSTV